MKRILYLFFGIIILVNTNYAQAPTWAQDVAPILYNKCTSCHHDGGLGHFPLLSYSDAYNKGFLIAAQVSNRTMPPWKPEANYGHFVGENFLTQTEIDAITNWVNYGRIQGDVTQAPSQPVYSNASQLGTYDVSIQMPAFTVGGTGDQHRNFPIPSGLLQDAYVTAVEVIPGNPQIVHHVIFYQDTTNAPYLLDSADAGLGYETVGLNSTARMIMAYTPGNRPYFPPVGTGVRVFKNTTYVIQVHYPDGSQGMIDSTRVNIRLTSIPQREITMWVLPGQKQMINGPINIPPNQHASFHEKDTVPAPLTLLAVMPHMHLLGKTIKNWMYNPSTGDTTKLVNIPDWDFHWQGNYFFNNTVKVPAGAILEAQATYDNTTDNPDNPNSPPQTVVEGPGTADEMMCIVASYMPYKNGDENLITDRKLVAQGAAVICPGHPVVLKTVEGNGYTYQWYKDNLLVNGATSSAYATSQPGSYYAQISLGANNTYTDTIAVTTGSVPVVHITPVDTVTLCTGTTVTLTADTGSNYSYQWFNDGVLLARETASSFIADKEGNYTVQVYSQCYAVSAPVNVMEEVCSGINKLEDNSITISPNPSSGTFAIDYNGFSSGTCSVSIYDMQGRIVYSDNAVSNRKQVISLHQVSNGCYFLQLKSSSGTIYKKVIIENR